jgi:hypothetical protein
LAKASAGVNALAEAFLIHFTKVETFAKECTGKTKEKPQRALDSLWLEFEM